MDQFLGSRPTALSFRQDFGIVIHVAAPAVLPDRRTAAGVAGTDAHDCGISIHREGAALSRQSPETRPRNEQFEIFSKKPRTRSGAGTRGPRPRIPGLHVSRSLCACVLSGDLRNGECG